MIWFMHCWSATMWFPFPLVVLIWLNSAAGADLLVCKFIIITQLWKHRHTEGDTEFSKNLGSGQSYESSLNAFENLKFSAGYVVNFLLSCIIASTFYSSHFTSSQEPTALSSAWDKVLFRSTKTFIYHRKVKVEWWWECSEGFKLEMKQATRGQFTHIYAEGICN